MRRLFKYLGTVPVEIMEDRYVFIPKSQAEEFKINLDALITLTKLSGIYDSVEFERGDPEVKYRFMKDGIGVFLNLEFLNPNNRIVEKVSIRTFHTEVGEKIAEIIDREDTGFDYNGKIMFHSDYETDFVNSLKILQRVL